MANIFLSVPVLGKPELKMMYTMYQAMASSRQHQIRLYFNENDSLISRVRNVHSSAFLNDFPECDYYMSLDSDLEILNHYQSDNIFNRLIDNDKDFTGGLYAIKKPGVRACASIALDAGNFEFNTGLREMLWLSSGCWCIKRSAMEKMAKAYPELEYNGDDNAAGKNVHGLFIPMLYDIKKDDFPGAKPPFRKYLSEDWSFCHRWRALGGQIYADTSIALRHIGSTPYTLFDVETSTAPQPQQPQQPQQPNSDAKLPPPGFERGNRD